MLDFKDSNSENGEMLRKLHILFFAVLLVGLTTCNGRLYARPKHRPTYDATQAQFNHLKAELEAGLGEEMQRLFPEGYFFSYVLYGLSAVNVGLNEPDLQTKTFLLEEARWAYEKLDSPAGYAAFPRNLSTEHGIFYNGWMNYLLSGILLLQDGDLNDAELARYKRESAEIAQAIAQSETPFLQSYSGQAWPVDMYPAMVSLKAMSQLTGEETYERLIADWLAETQQYLDPATGLIPHRTEPFADSGRATSQTLIVWFLAELDPELADETYRKFREQFVTRRLGIPAVREFPQGDNRPGDVDSGPLITGVSLSATVVMLGAARMNGDDALATAIYQEGEAGGWPFSWQGKRKYGLGVLPIGEAFLLWTQTARPWLAQIGMPQIGMSQIGLANEAPAVGFSWPWWWRLPTHGISLLLLWMIRPRSKRT